MIVQSDGNFAWCTVPRHHESGENWVDWSRDCWGLPSIQTTGRMASFFVNYTGLDGSTVISRFQVSANPNLASSSSEVEILRQPQPDYKP